MSLLLLHFHGRLDAFTDYPWPGNPNELLQLPEQGYSAVVLCAAGDRADSDQYATLPKVRYDPETVLGYYD